MRSKDFFASKLAISKSFDLNSVQEFKWMHKFTSSSVLNERNKYWCTAKRPRSCETLEGRKRKGKENWIERKAIYIEIKQYKEK